MTNILDKLANEVDKIAENEDVSEEKNVKKASKGNAVDVQENVSNSVMASLMDEAGFDFPQVGESATGKVIEVSSNEIYLDLGPFGTGVVLGKEIKDGLGTGKLKMRR
jgi:hypothetical protein